ncbi:hypothetical protein GOBAR_DD30073 [Gossypium barbadense]|nr:hypothetical protein GOBAR_DD30073 [Gossypium barbadense]
MSAYGHQMEREFSAQSLLSRGDTGTEMGSRYVSESGFYMTSFAATIFIAGLVTIGVVLVTSVVSLAVMLQSCENKSKGVVATIDKANDNHHYCEILALHGELNGLKPDNVPPLCRNLAVQYIETGGYTRDLDFVMRMIENFFDTVSPSKNRTDAVLIDIDNILVSDPSVRRILESYTKLHSRGWLLILLSRKHEKQRHVTTKHLNSLGFSGWSSLIMRSDLEMEMGTREYFCRRRTEMKEQGNEIMSVISSQMDALMGLSLGIQLFKLPNPLYYNFENNYESRIHGLVQIEN